MGGDRRRDHKRRRDDFDAKPCRVLFIRNVDFSVTASEVRALFEPFGEIKNIFDLIEKRGLIFITFYDLRAAQSAKNAISGSDLKGRRIDIHFSKPKDSDLRKGADKDSNQGSLMVDFKSRETLNPQELQDHLGRYGQIKELGTCGQNQFIVEYYDSRDTIHAYESIRKDDAFRGGYLVPKYIWDERQDHSYRAHQPTTAPTSSLLGALQQSMQNSTSMQPPMPMQSAMPVPVLNQAQQAAQLTQLLTMLQQGQFQQPPTYQPVQPPVQVPQYSANASPQTPSFPAPKTDASQWKALASLLQKK